MASNKISVTVKTLCGECIQLDVNPSLVLKDGLKEIEKQLNKFDSNVFPHDLTRVIHIKDCEEDDKNDEEKITSESNLAVVVRSTNTFLIDKTFDNSKRHHFSFKVRDDSDLHVYIKSKISRYSYINDTNVRTRVTHNIPSFYVSLQPNLENIEKCPLTNNCLFWELSQHKHVTPRDAHIIYHIVKNNLQKDIQAPVYMNIKDKIPIFCTCGHLVALEKMKAHIDTKRKHLIGDKEGLEFLARSNTYIESV